MKDENENLWNRRNKNETRKKGLKEDERGWKRSKKNDR